MMMKREQDEQPRVFYELSALVLNLLRSPSSPIPFSDHSPIFPPTVSSSRRSPPKQISLAGLTSMLLGISLALMLGGSVTFFIGFMLMPWVLGLVMVFYVAGIVSTLSMIARSIICYATSPSNPRKEIPKLPQRKEKLKQQVSENKKEKKRRPIAEEKKKNCRIVSISFFQKSSATLIIKPSATLITIRHQSLFGI